MVFQVNSTKLSVMLVVFLMVSSSFLLAACGGEKNESKGQVALTESEMTGKRLATSTCLGCHSVDGKPGAGPSFKGLYESEVKLTDGAMVIVDEQYLKTAIVDPDAQIRKGYSPKMMANALASKSYSEEQVNDMVSYIKTLK